MRSCVRRLYHAYVPVCHERSAARMTTMQAVHPQSVTQAFRATEAAATEADRQQEEKGFFYLPKLDYDVGAGVAPLMTKDQFELQYHVFHKHAVSTLNEHTMGTQFEGHSLDVVIRKTSFDATNAVIHSAAAEHFNYCFWYQSLRPWGTPMPSRLREALQLQFSRNGSLNAVEEVQRLVMVTALSQQTMCGWVYLVWKATSGFQIVEFPHGTCPIGADVIPLLALNTHASAMAVDYNPESNESIAQYVSNFFKTCNWRLAERYYLESISA